MISSIERASCREGSRRAAPPRGALEPGVGPEEVSVREVVHREGGQPRDELVHGVAALLALRGEARALERRRMGSLCERAGGSVAPRGTVSLLPRSRDPGREAPIKRARSSGPCLRKAPLRGGSAALPRSEARPRWCCAADGASAPHLEVLVDVLEDLERVEDGDLPAVDGPHERRDVARGIQLEVPRLELRRHPSWRREGEGRWGGGRGVLSAKNANDTIETAARGPAQRDRGPLGCGFRGKW